MELVLDKARFSYANGLYTPRENTSDSGEKTYKHLVTLLVAKGSKDVENLEAAVLSAGKEAWGEKAAGILAKLHANNRVCLRDGDLMLDDDGKVENGFAGMMFIRASKTADGPTGIFARVYNRNGVKLTDDNYRDLAMGAGRGPRSGDYGQAIVRVWAQDNKYGQRVNCELVAVAFRSEGPSLGRAEKTDDEIKGAFGGFEEQSINAME